MPGFAEETLSRAPASITVPEPIRLLFEWIEAQGYVAEDADGDQYGTLNGASRLRGSNVEIRGNRDHEGIAESFGPIRSGRPVLWPFCSTGGDGSEAALWHSPDGRDLVVHMGSGSGSITACVLGDDPVDFLRLLAIGYDEVCWSEDWSEPPVATEEHDPVNQPFRDWVTSTFGADIPARGLDVVPRPAEYGDTDTDDAWCLHLNSLRA